MAQKWYEEAEKKLGQGNIEKSYEGQLDGQYGYLLLGKKELSFVHEEGLFRKKVVFDLNIPYNNIKKIDHKGDHGFALNQKNGKTHIFASQDTKVSPIEKDLEALIK